MTTASQARDIARRWVDQHAQRLEGFAGAYLTGSVGRMDPDTTVPETSDVDIVVVLDGVTPPPGVLADPAGWLMPLQAAVAMGFPRRAWVVRRCEHVMDKVRRRFADLQADRPLADQVVAWVFPTAVLAHVLLVADLRNPTVRRRYVDAREVLAGIGRLDVYEDLLGLLGCADMSAATVARHLDALAGTFDAAASVASTTTWAFATDISPATRPIAIDGSADLIAAGHHRAAVFWIAASYAKCLMVLREATPDRDPRPLAAGFLQLVDDLGVPSYDALHRRRLTAEAYLPELWDVAGAVIGANPRIAA
ncbi:hypothetical protein BH23ACT10_BH23ACT10_25150 [soil metagenome]